MAAHAKTAKTPVAVTGAARGVNQPPTVEERKFLRRLEAKELIQWGQWPGVTPLAMRLARRGWVSYRRPGWTLTEAGRKVLDKTSCWA